MRPVRWMFVLALTLGLSCTPRYQPGESLEDFRLLTSDGSSFQLSHHMSGNLILVAGLGNSYRAQLEDWNKLDSYEVCVLEERENVRGVETGLTLLIDPTFLVSESLGLQNRGEALVILNGGEERRVFRKLSDLARELKLKPLVSKAPVLPLTQNPLPDFTYDDHVAPIVADKCQACHRSGGMAPFPFEQWSDLSERASMIQEVLLTGRMPPWSVEPGHRALLEDKSLTPLEKRALVDWLKRGAPKGRQNPDPLSLSAETYPIIKEWVGGEPSLILEAPDDFVLQADSLAEYKYVTLDPGLEEDVFLIGAELLPGESRAVHHLVVYTHQSPDFQLEKLFQDGTLLALGPPYDEGGQARGRLEDSGILLRKGSKLTLQYHLTSFGKQVRFRPRLGLHLTRKKPKTELKLVGFQNTEIDLAPGEKDDRIEAQVILKKGTKIHGFVPHMHYRGRSASLSLGKDVLLRVPNYDFNWQFSYWFKDAVVVKEDSTLTFAGSFDNSELNPQNPDPSARVRFGDGSNDEMLLGILILSDEDSNDSE